MRQRSHSKSGWWLAGNSAGSLVRRSEEVDATLKALRVDQLKPGQ
jgi:hypothetical protein